MSRPLSSVLLLALGWATAGATPAFTSTLATIASGAGLPSLSNLAGAGQAVGSADLDGDGHPELIIGAPASGTSPGTVYSVKTDPSTFAMLSSVALTSNQGGFGALDIPAAARFGTSVAPLYHAASDGKSMMAVGAPGHSLGVGAVYILFLDANPVSVDSFAVVSYGSGGLPTLAGTTGQLGNALAYLGDVDGDSATVGLAVGIPDAPSDGQVMIWWISASTGQVTSTIALHRGAGGIGSGQILGAGQFGASVARVQTAAFESAGGGFTLAVGDSAYDVAGSSFAGAVIMLSLKDSPPNVVRTSVHTNGEGGVPASTLGNQELFGAAVASVGNTLSDSWATTTMLVSAPGNDGAGFSAGAVYVLVHSTAPGMAVQTVTKLLPGSSGFTGATPGFLAAWGSSLFASKDLTGSGAASHVLVGGSGRNGQKGEVLALVLDDARPLAMAVSLAAVETAGTEPPLLRESPFQRLPTVAVGPDAGFIVPVRLPASAAGQAALVSLQLGGRPCNATTPAPAGWWAGKGLMCVGLPGVPVETAVDMTAGGLTLAIVAPGSVTSSTAEAFTTTRGWLRVAPGTGALLAGSIADKDEAGSAVAFLGDIDGDGIPNGVAVGVPESRGGGSVLIMTLQTYASGQAGQPGESSASQGPVVGGAGNRRSLSGSQAPSEFGMAGTGLPLGYVTISDGTAGLPAGTLSAGDSFGRSVALVHGMTLADQNAMWDVTIAVGAPGDDAAGSQAGRVYLLSYSTAEAAVTGVRSIVPGSKGLSNTGLGAGARFGAAVIAGALPATILVGAPGAASGTGAVVRITLNPLSGSVLSSELFAPNEGGMPAGIPAAGSAFGSSIALARTSTAASAVPAIIVGAPNHNDEGGTMVVLQRSILSTVSAAQSFTPAESGSLYGQCGAALASADLDGDGIDEVLIGSPESGTAGAVHLVFLRENGSPRAAAEVTAPGGSPLMGSGASTDSLVGSSIAFLHDLNGGGHAAEFIIGAPSALDSNAKRTGGFAVLSLGSQVIATADVSSPQSAELSVTGVITGAGGIPQAGGLVALEGQGLRGGFASHARYDVSVQTGLCTGSKIAIDGSRLQCQAPPGYGTTNVSLVVNGLTRSWLKHDPADAMIASYAAPVLTSVTSQADIGRLPQAGGSSAALVVIGTGLLDTILFEAASGVRLLIGPYECTSLDRSPGGTQLTCTDLPPGVGGPHAVRMVLPGGQASNPLQVSYAPASITGISPAAVQPSLTETVAMNISGSGFGFSPASVTRVVIGGNDCASIVWVSPSLVRCLNASLARLTSRDVTVYTGGIRSEGGLRRLEYDDPPSMVGVVPSVVPAAGGVNITFFAANLAGASIADIFIGKSPCLAWAVTDGFQGWCTVPRGSGRDVMTFIHTAGGIVGESVRGLVDYRAPSISAIAPAFATSNVAVPYTFRISGLDFGAVPGTLGSASVGGVPCAPAVRISDTALECRNVTAPWSNFLVSVTVGGQQTTATGVFSYLPPPVITSVVPSGTSTLGGDSIRIEGEGFGNLTEVSVGGTPCASFVRVSSFVVTCVSPPGVGADRIVRVVTASNGDASLSAFSYSRPAVTAIARLLPDGTPRTGGRADAFAGEQDVGLMLTVTGAGTSATTVEAAGVATASWSARCSAVTVAERTNGTITAVTCAGLNLITAPAAGEAVATPYITVAGQQSAAGSSPVALTIIGKPQVSAVAPSANVPTAGGTVLSVVGSFFGSSQSDVLAVRVGRQAATILSHVSSSELRVGAPRDVGSGVHVTVITRGGLSSEGGTATIDYARPKLVSVLPPYLIGGDLAVPLELAGTDLGFGAQDVQSVRVGDAPCTAVSVTATGSLRCTLNASLLGTATNTLSIVAMVGGQDSLPLSIGMQGTPSVQVITPGEVPTVGLGSSSSAPVTVRGSNFGNGPQDLASVTVSGVQVPIVEWRSSSELRVAVQPGAGADAPLIVTTRGGLGSRALPLLSYGQAEVVSIDPPYAMTGNLSLTFAITGINFGNSQADLTAVSVGGTPCSSGVWVSPTLVRCVDVRADAFESSSVTVTVGGQVGLKNSFLDRSPPPSIRTVSPTVASVGDVVLILGEGFGRQRSDIKQVTVAGAPCTTVTHEGSTAVQCTMPPVADHLLGGANLDPTLLGNLPVIVETIGGLKSVPSRVSYPGAGVPLRTAPGLTVGWRAVGQTGTVDFRWAFPRDNPTDAVAAVTSFGFEMAAAGAQADTAAGASEGSLASSVSSNSQVVALSGTPTETTDGQVLYTHTLAAIQAKPVVVRVRAENPTGSGPWSNWSSPIAANCQRNEYLTTQKEVKDWECEVCPPGAFCGGTAASNVTSKAGFWRVPWSPAGIGFRRCPLARACLGFEGSDSAAAGVFNTTAASTASPASRRLFSPGSASDVLSRLRAPQAVPSSSLGDPYADETCAPGYTGILCAECSPGYSRWNQHECAKCADPTAVILVMLGVSVVACAAIGFFIFGALKAGSQQGASAESTKVMVPGVKIVFSHLQTVAIAASLNLRWPVSVVRLFGAMQVVSSVSSDVLSLDCALPFVASRLGDTLAEAFFARSAVMLMVPVILVVLAGFAWVFIVPCLRPFVGPFLRACPHSCCGMGEKKVEPQTGDGSGGGGGVSARRSTRMGRFVPDGRRASVTDTVSQVVALPPIKPRKAWTASRDASVDGDDSKAAAAAATPAPPPLPPSKDSPKERAAERAGGARPDGPDRKAVVSVAPRRGSASRRASSSSSDSSVTTAPVSGPPHAIRLTVLDKLTVAAIVVGFAVHMSVTKTSLALLTCTTISHEGAVAPGSSVEVAGAKATATAECAGRDPSRRLAAELGICCNDPSQQTYMYALGVPGILIYAFGIPLIAALALYSRRASLVGDQRTRTVLGFLYLGFKPNAYFWESITMVRKAAVATIAVLLAPTGSANQTYAAILIVFLLTVAHLVVLPYQDAMLNRLELAALVTAFLTFEFGLFLTDESTGSSAVAELSTVAIFTVNCMFLALAAWTIGRAAMQESGFSKRFGHRKRAMAPPRKQDADGGQATASQAVGASPRSKPAVRAGGPAVAGTPSARPRRASTSERDVTSVGPARASSASGDSAIRPAV